MNNMAIKMTGKNWKLLVLAIALGGLGFVIGAFAVAPGWVTASDVYVPPSLASMPLAVVSLTTGTAQTPSTTIQMVVRVADTPSARADGLRNAGLNVLNSTVLLYSYPTTQTRVTYNTNKVRGPIELAVVGELGQVVEIKKVALGTPSVLVTTKHRFVFAAKEGLLGRLGITVGTAFSPTSLQKIP